MSYTSLPQAKRQFGEKLRRLRREKGLSQEKLAQKSKASRAYIGHLEAGTRTPSFRQLYFLAKALDIEIYELFR